MRSHAGYAEQRPPQPQAPAQYSLQSNSARAYSPGTNVARPPAGSARLIGIGCLLVTACGWGANWPATKFLLSVCPPLTARGIAGIAAALFLFGLASARRESLAVPRGQRTRMVAAALLNVSAWMGLTTLSLSWLRASEAVTLAYTMPVWTALLAWPILREPLRPLRLGALAAGLLGIAVLVRGDGVEVAAMPLPGLMIALSAALLFALGTVLSKRWPLDMPPMAATTWQVGIGCIPLLVAGLLLENSDLPRLPWFGWLALSYTALASMGLCYLTWFAALRRLDAATAAIGTLLTPIVGVIGSNLVIAEPLRLSHIIALALILSGVVLATRPNGTRIAGRDR